MPSRLFLDAEDPWVNWDWLLNHVPYVLDALEQHLVLTVIAVVGGLAISIPLGLLAHRAPLIRLVVIGGFGAFYTIPSLAVFALLVPFTGIATTTTAEIPLIGYNVFILLRNVVVGLDAVPREVLDAADGMGYRPRARMLRVELPLALPAIFAGLRVATVSTIGLITITAVIGLGGLGQLINQGLQENFRTPLVVATLGSIALALVADLALSAGQRFALPWSRQA
ncbi:MAG TPA: ABC transporter permease [Candidatus Dormibacteraeota bacterium]|nr:ABC transporter permease [Candidatus Dormibacteraeota bacterium]